MFNVFNIGMDFIHSMIEFIIYRASQKKKKKIHIMSPSSQNLLLSGD